VILLRFGGERVLDGAMSPGDFVAMFSYLQIGMADGWSRLYVNSCSGEPRAWPESTRYCIPAVRSNPP
jgi:hypothetical protein